MEILSALDYAHSRGIVHRDIKPSNMMITSQGQVKLMDFGIARVMSDPSLTQAHQTTGSLYYMSPEQINGVANLDGRSDLYSLAVSLYEMVTGRRPFDGENTFAIMAAHMQQPPVPPVQLDSRVPPALSNVILRGMAKRPEDRFQTAGEFRAALGQVFQPQVQPQPQPQPQPQAQPQSQLQAPVHQQAPVAPPQSKSPRTMYMLAGSLATVAVAAVLITQAPKFLRTNAQQPPVTSQQQPQVEQPKVSTQPEVQTQTPELPPQSQPQAQQQQPPPPVKASVPSSPQRGPVTTSTPVSQTPTAGYSPQQMPQQQQPPPQQQQREVAQPPTPQAPAVDRAGLDEQRKRVIQMAQRIVTAKAAYQQLRESMAQQGLRPRADLQGSTQRMQFEMDQAEAALNGGNAAQAKQHLDYAERALEAVEKALNL